MDIKFSDNSADSEVAVTIVFDEDKLDIESKYLKRCVKNDANFNAKRGQTLLVPAPKGVGYKKVLLLGAGKLEDFGSNAREALGSILYKSLDATGMKSADIFLTDHENVSLSRAFVAADIANGMKLKSYKWDKYKSNSTAPALSSVNFDMGSKREAKEARAQYKNMKAVTDGAFWARDLSNEAPNVLYPETFAEEIDNKLSSMGVKVTILDEKQMEKLGMGAALAVGKGSERPPRMVIMEYNGTDNNDAPLALVGKGVTFDTGGVSLKPGMSMKGMKYDMGGAAAVVGAMQALAGRKAKSHVVGIVGLAENMPSSSSCRVDDIVTTMSGQTVEIHNTDAEGRLVLCDAITYVQEKYKPHTVIDLATLTGACVAALGHTMAGVFSNDDELWGQIEWAGKHTNELGWRLPLHEHFAQATRGTVTDLKNVGAPGASAAAEFLHAFIDDGVKWAHIDIAGMAFGVNGHPTLPDGIGTGFGVRLLEQLVSGYYEVYQPTKKASKKPSTGNSPSPG
jgi:leucyl aminopeptidase